MTNQQGAPEALTDFEHRHAIRQGYEIAASARYFEARPQIDSSDRRKAFQAGFERGWDRLAALVEAQQPAPSAAADWKLVPEGPTPDMVRAGWELLPSATGDRWDAGAVLARSIYSAMLAAAPQPSPTAQAADSVPCSFGGPELQAMILAKCVEKDRASRAPADSQPAPEYVGNGMFKGETIQKAAEHWANWCDRRCMTGLSEFLRVVAARAPADSVTAPAGGAAILKEILAAACCEDSETYLTSDQYRKLYDLQRRIESMPTPPTQAADSVLKDHQIAALVNELRGIAIKYHDTQQLRERIARAVVPALKAQAADSVLYDPKAALEVFNRARAGSDKPVGYLRGILAVIAHWESRPEPHRWMVPTKAADSVLEDAARLEFEMQHAPAIERVRKQGGAT